MCEHPSRSAILCIAAIGTHPPPPCDFGKGVARVGVLGFDGAVRLIELLLHDPEHRHDRRLLSLQRVWVLAERERDLLLRLVVELEGAIDRVLRTVVVEEGSGAASGLHEPRRSRTRASAGAARRAKSAGGGHHATQERGWGKLLRGWKRQRGSRWVAPQGTMLGGRVGQPW